MAGVEQGRALRQVVRAIGETPWVMRPAEFRMMTEVIARKIDGASLTAEQVESIVAAGTGPGGEYQAEGALAVLPIYGVLVPRASMMTEMSGGTSLARISAALDAVAAEPAITTLVLDISSPGGSVEFTPEVADKVRAIGESKRTVAVVNPLAASGAYWIASQASEIVVTPSGQVGSIGVYTAHDDVSAAQEKEGVKTTLVSAGKYKVETSPYAPLTEEARGALQAMVDEYYGMFVAAVAKGRGVQTSAVRKGFGEGRTVTARRAVAEGMADRVDTFDNTIARLIRSKGAGRSRAGALGLTLEDVQAAQVDSDAAAAEEAAAVDAAARDEGTHDVEETELLEIAAKVGAITTSLTGGNT